jgi:sec-independent protein translocase protein TatA
MLLFLDISGGELLVILLFVLLFFGSKSIPDISRTLGKGIRQLRDATNEVQREIHREAGEVKRGFDAQQNRTRPASRSAARYSGTPPAPPEGPAEEPPAGGGL